MGDLIERLRHYAGAGTDGRARFPMPAGERVLMESAADEIERLRRAAAAVVAIRPANWDDDEDPEQRAAWLALDAALAGQEEVPVPVTIFCPSCAVPHVDEGEWATTRHHKTHQCQSCGHEWRPFPFATVGVAHPTPATPAAAAFREALATLPGVAERFAAGQQFNAYSLSEDDDRKALCIGPITSLPLSLFEAPAAVADLVEAAFRVAREYLSASAPAVRPQPSLRDKADHLITDAAHRRAEAELDAIRANTACTDCLGQGGDAGSRFNPCPTCGKARAHG